MTNPYDSENWHAAKPTLYRGVRYRSRLEARFAALFTVMGLKFVYEPVIPFLHGWAPDFGFRLGNGTPMLVEVKPSQRRYWRPKVEQAVTGTPYSGFIWITSRDVCAPRQGVVARHTPVLGLESWRQMNFESKLSAAYRERFEQPGCALWQLAVNQVLVHGQDCEAPPLPGR